MSDFPIRNLYQKSIFILVIPMIGWVKKRWQKLWITPFHCLQLYFLDRYVYFCFKLSKSDGNGIKSMKSFISLSERLAVGFRLWSENRNWNQWKNAGTRNLFDMWWSDHFIHWQFMLCIYFYFFFAHILCQTPVAQLAEQILYKLQYCSPFQFFVSDVYFPNYFF